MARDNKQHISAKSLHDGNIIQEFLFTNNNVMLCQIQSLEHIVIVGDKIDVLS